MTSSAEYAERADEYALLAEAWIIAASAQWGRSKEDALLTANAYAQLAAASAVLAREDTKKRAQRSDAT